VDCWATPYVSKIHGHVWGVGSSHVNKEKKIFHANTFPEINGFEFD